jgi:hypothetical protein
MQNTVNTSTHVNENPHDCQKTHTHTLQKNLKQPQYKIHTKCIKYPQYKITVMYTVLGTFIFDKLVTHLSLTSVDYRIGDMFSSKMGLISELVTCSALAWIYVYN